MLRSILLATLVFITASQTLLAQRAREGAKAPEISGVTLLNSDQETVTLASLEGKVVILEFWATWCGPCVQTAHYLDELQTSMGDKLQIVSLSDESKSEVSTFLRRRPSSAMVGVYEGSAVSSAYPHSAIPHGILIGPDGTVVKIDHPMTFTQSMIEQVFNGTYGNASSSEGGGTRDWETLSGRNSVKPGGE